MAKIAIVGFGVVGSGVYKVIQDNCKSVGEKAGESIEVKYILARHAFKGEEFENKIIRDFEIIENDPEIEVVSESIGGVGDTYDYTVRALKAGKSVVTSNKELVATHGWELMDLAKKNHVNYMFEASVGGGIPVIRPMFTCLAANEIEEICGILNGTTNYILTKMIRENVSFADALKEAQELGYAEKDPTADVCGIDAQRKISILTSVALGEHVLPDSVYAEGITKISLQDVEFADKFGCAIKLIGHAVMKNEKTYAYVAPHLVNKDNMLSGVWDVFNAVMVKGNMVDDVLFYGKGAGKLPTASAMVADIIDCVKHSKIHISRKWIKPDGNIIAPIGDYVSKFYISFKGNKKDIEKVFPVEKSISSGDVTAVITKEITTAFMEEGLTKLGQNGQVISRLYVL